MADTALDWHDIRGSVEGKGYTDTERYYDRLPARAKGVVPDVVWGLSRTATGMCAMFTTDAPEIHARWELLNDQIGEPNFPVAGFSGLDLYADDNGTWKWAAAGHQVKDKHPECCLVNGLAEGLRSYRVYLPLRNPVESVVIGVPKGAHFSFVAPRSVRPVVFYGTSIVHGAYSSHPGIVHPSIIGRRIDRPVINLGFSGNAKMEESLAHLVAEIDASVYVIDALPNMDMTLVRERAEKFIRILCGKRPKTPVLLVEDRPYTNYWIRPNVKRSIEEKWAEFRRIYELLKHEGVGQLSYIEGRYLFGDDAEASIDTSHPSDLGFMRMADVLTPVIRSLL
ncbi:MAG: SGNH/GDSL hydrolase family protein [Spirochaetota bacterium]